MKRLLCLLLAFSFLLTMLVACGGTTPGGEEGVTTEAPEVPETPLVIAENGASEFRIIYDRLEVLDVATLESKIKTMADKIEENTGAKVSRASTNANTYSKESFEILVGTTGYEESIAAAKDLRLKDYNVVRDGNKIVIVGGSADALVTAITWFTNKVLDGKDASTTGSIVFTQELERAYRFGYKANSLVAAGAELKDFTIVYPEDYTAAEHETAYILCDYLQQYYGYVLPVASDRKDHDKEILIGKTARTTITAGTNEFRVEVSENKVQILGGSTVAYEQIPQYFYEQFIPLGKVSNTTQDMTTLLEARKDSILGTTGDIRIIFHNVYGGTTPSEGIYTNPILRWNLDSNLYEEYMADILCLQEFNNVPRTGGDSSLASRLAALGYKEVPTNKYAVKITYKNGDKTQGISNFSITEGGDQTPNTPIFYNPEKLELLNYGDYVYTSGLTDAEINSLYSVYKHKLGTRYDNPAIPSSASQQYWDYERYNDNIRYGGLSKTTVWAIFKDKTTGKVFAVASVHLDHQDTCYSNERRAKQAMELMNEINTKILVGEYVNIPVIFGGDINTCYNREDGKYKSTGAITNFEAAGYADVQTTFAGADQASSYGGYANFDRDKNYFTSIGSNSGDASDSIDHCLYKGSIEPTLFDVVDHIYGRRTSDHLPLVVDFAFK
ncbi:MAG: hypothetical protein IJX28_04685 [Clostridia bacterium]|nr:hypothetical protein [Clostridia bacterium]